MSKKAPTTPLSSQQIKKAKQQNKRS